MTSMIPEQTGITGTGTGTHTIKTAICCVGAGWEQNKQLREQDWSETNSYGTKSDILVSCKTLLWMLRQYKPFGLSTLVNKQTTKLHFAKMLQSRPQNSLSCLSHKHTNTHSTESSCVHAYNFFSMPLGGTNTKSDF